jgi:hypothetical protein
MAIQKSVRIMLWAVADRNSTSFTVNLAQDGSAYWVGQSRTGGMGGRIMNWFTEHPTAAKPTGAAVVAGADTVSLDPATLILTVTVPLKAQGTRHEIVVDLLFP